MKARTTIVAAALALTTACASVPTATSAASPWPEETPVPLGQAVRVGALVVTPLKVVEDSRCPMNARCVWAGRVVVQTRIAGTGWRETANLTLRQVYRTHGQMLALDSVQPAKTTGGAIGPRDYRFVYQRRDDRFGGPPPIP